MCTTSLYQIIHVHHTSYSTIQRHHKTVGGNNILHEHAHTHIYTRTLAGTINLHQCAAGHMLVDTL